MTAKLWPDMTDSEQVQAILIMKSALLGMCERMSREMTEFLASGKAPFRVEITGRLVKNERELPNGHGTAIPSA